MKKILYYALAALIIPALGFGTLGGKDIGSLIPVQVVLVQSAGENIRLVTDTGDEGTGKTVGQAIASMQETASGEIYLDTAEHLLLEEGADLWLDQLEPYLRPSCTLCRISGNEELSKLAEYLRAHPPELTIAEYEAGEHVLPHLICKKGRTKLVSSKVIAKAAGTLAGCRHRPNGGAADSRILMACPGSSDCGMPAVHLSSLAMGNRA